jgi:hypothetical protein
VNGTRRFTGRAKVAHFFKLPPKKGIEAIFEQFSPAGSRRGWSSTAMASALARARPSPVRALLQRPADLVAVAKLESLIFPNYPLKRGSTPSLSSSRLLDPDAAGRAPPRQALWGAGATARVSRADTPFYRAAR